MFLDKLITTFDTGLRTVFAQANPGRQRPDANIEELTLSEVEKNQGAALMRINHVGEVCAQALYSGQAFTSRNPQVVQSLQKAADEEIDHLAWCEARINELGGRKSWLNPVWYIGSFTLGAAAGALNDKWNLGFLAETERQVANHLLGHLSKLSEKDIKTRTIVNQMQQDESAHAQEARDLGANDLPEPIKAGMKFASKIMTSTAYYV
jgi:ubiquinone biosynthesis monooxygenase Coq7